MRRSALGKFGRGRDRRVFVFWVGTAEHVDAKGSIGASEASCSTSGDRERISDRIDAGPVDAPRLPFFRQIAAA
jgi:hypothetical protein